VPISRCIATAVVLLVSLFAISPAAMQFAEAEVAVGDEWAHAPRLGERERFQIVAFAGRLSPIAEKVVGVSRKTHLKR